VCLDHPAVLRIVVKELLLYAAALVLADLTLCAVNIDKSKPALVMAVLNHRDIVSLDTCLCGSVVEVNIAVVSSRSSSVFFKYFLQNSH